MYNGVLWPNNDDFGRQVVNGETGDKLGPNQVGEICVHTPFPLREYLNRPMVR